MDNHQNIDSRDLHLPRPQYQPTYPVRGAPSYTSNPIQDPDVSQIPGSYPQLGEVPPPYGDTQLANSNNATVANQAGEGQSYSINRSPSIGNHAKKHKMAATVTEGSHDDDVLEDIYIAIMGVTGVGKSQFIQLCTESRAIKIGHNLLSCTQDVGEHSFVYRDKLIHLIDTPGFDDTTRSDREVLDDIAVWFGTAYRAKVQLTAILYLHRISDPKMGGTAYNNFKMFKKLCGETYYPRVSLCTTYWDTVSKRDGVRREEELLKTDEFWGHMVNQGSKTFRHYGDRDSAMVILNSIIRHRKDKQERNAPSYVRVQTEMVEENKSLDETSAGRVVNAKILEERRKFEKELREAKEDMKVYMEEGDRRAEQAAKKHKEMIEAKLKQWYEDQEKLKVKLEDMELQHIQEIQKLLKAMEAQKDQIEALKSQNQAKAEQLRHIDPQSPRAVALRADINANNEKVQEVEEELEEQEAKLEQKKSLIVRAYEWAKRHPDGLRKVGAIAGQLAQNIIAAHRIRLVQKRQQLSEPAVKATGTVYELEEVVDHQRHPGQTHASVAGLVENGTS